MLLRHVCSQTKVVTPAASLRYCFTGPNAHLSLPPSSDLSPPTGKPLRLTLQAPKVSLGPQEDHVLEPTVDA